MRNGRPIGGLTIANENNRRNAPMQNIMNQINEQQNSIIQNEENQRHDQNDVNLQMNARTGEPQTQNSQRVTLRRIENNRGMDMD